MDDDQKTKELLIWKAAREGNLSFLKKLVHDGCSIESNALSGTPLHNAISGAHLDCVKFLIDQNANINSVTEAGWTVLHRAARLSDTRFMDLVIGKINNINAQNDIGMTALHYAVKEQFFNCVKLLLTNGARTDILNNKLETPVTLAIENNHTFIHCLLMSAREQKYLMENIVGIDNQSDDTHSLEF